MPTIAEDLLKELGFSYLPQEMKPSPLEPRKVAQVLNEQLNSKKQDIINQAPQGVNKTEADVRLKAPGLANKLKNLEESHKQLMDLLNKGQLEAEIQKMSQPFVQGETKAVQDDYSAASKKLMEQQYLDWEKKCKASMLENPLGGSQQQIGVDNVFLWLINCVIYNFSAGLPKGFNPEAPQNSEILQGLKTQTPNLANKNFVEAAKKKFGDNIEFVGLNEEKTSFKGVLTKDSKVLKEFDEWAKANYPMANDEELEQAKHQAKTVASARLT